MDSTRRGSDLIKIQTIQGLLEQQFIDVKFTPHPRPTFSFHGGVPKASWLLVLNSEFLIDQNMSIDALRGFIEEKVLKKVLYRSRFLGHGYSPIGPDLWSRRWAIAVPEPTVDVVF